MPRKAMKNVPRRPKQTASDKQERFAKVYFETLDKLRAAKEAGYEFASDDIGHVVASRLLRTPTVQVILDRLRTQACDKASINGATVITRLFAVYLAAMDEKDFSAAVSALDKIGKHLGIYERHNAQKKYSQEDVERLRGELEAAGFSFARVNFPQQGRVIPLPRPGESNGDTEA